MEISFFISGNSELIVRIINLVLEAELLSGWYNPAQMKRCLFLGLVVLVVVVAAAIFYLIRRPGNLARNGMVWEFLQNPEQHQNWVIEAGIHCGEAPFQFPTTGFIGYLWGDFFRPGHRHQGVDIFSGTEPGVTPVYAAYAGYLTRLPDWRSSVIIRIPSDPLHPGQEINTYYTHMADPAGNSFIAAAFPAGSEEVFVEEGTLLGYQGNYSGTPGNPTGVHLHFSIVRSDPLGGFLNELEFANTQDPSPYFGLALNASVNLGDVPLCPSTTPTP
jgi:hypothetical protein